MANSKAIWCITYSDYTVEFVKALDVWQIIDGANKLKGYIDNIVSISRVNFVDIFESAEEADMKDLSEYEFRRD